MQNLLTSDRRTVTAAIEIEGPAGQVTLRLDGLLQLLGAFETPASTAAVLSALPARGASDWAEHAAALVAQQGPDYRTSAWLLFDRRDH